MPSDKGSQGTAATVLQEAARHLIASMDALRDRVQERRLAEQAFELLRQAAKLDEEEKETLDPRFPSDIDCSPGLEQGSIAPAASRFVMGRRLSWRAFCRSAMSAICCISSTGPAMAVILTIKPGQDGPKMACTASILIPGCPLPGGFPWNRMLLGRGSFRRPHECNAGRGDSARCFQRWAIHHPVRVV